MQELKAVIRGPLFREFLSFGPSTVLEQGSRLGTALVAAGFLGPSVWGRWYLLNLILRYGALAHLGALNGLNRQYALEVGRGNDVEAESLRKATLGALALSIAVVAVMTGVAGAISGATASFQLIGLTLVLLAVQQLYVYTTMTFKSRIRFGSVSRLQTGLAVVTPTFTLPLTFAFAIKGFIVGQSVSYAVVALAAYRVDPSLYQARFDLARSKRLIGIGFPIMLVGVLYSLLVTVDRWVIIRLMSAEALGHYSIAVMALGTAAMLSQVVGQQYYPRMAGSWGAKGDIAQLHQLARMQEALALALTVAVVSAAELAGPPLIRRFLPEYVPGIPAFRIIMLAPIIGCFGQGYANILNVTDRQYRYLGVILVSLVVNVVGSYLLGTMLGLEGVAWGTVASFAAFSGGLIFSGEKRFPPPRRDAVRHRRSDADGAGNSPSRSGESEGSGSA